MFLVSSCVFKFLSVQLVLVWSTRYVFVFQCFSVLPCLALLDFIKDCTFDFILISMVLVPPRCVCTVTKNREASVSFIFLNA